MLEKITAWSTFALALMAAIGLPITWYQIRQFRNAAQVEHIDEFVQRWDHELVPARKNLALKRLDAKQKNLVPLDANNPPDDMLTILNFYEDMDVLVDRGSLDEYDVWREFSSAMFPFYADVHPVIVSFQRDNPSLYKGFPSLMEAMEREEREENGGVDTHPSADDILDLYQGDADLQPDAPVQIIRPKPRHRHQ